MPDFRNLSFHFIVWEGIAVKNIVKAGLLALVVGGVGLALPVQDAEAATRCRTVYSHGVTKRVCTTKPTVRVRTTCNYYWRHGVKYRSCRRVYY